VGKNKKSQQSRRDTDEASWTEVAIELTGFAVDTVRRASTSQGRAELKKEWKEGAAEAKDSPTEDIPYYGF